MCYHQTFNSELKKEKRKNKHCYSEGKVCNHLILHGIKLISSELKKKCRLKLCKKII